MGSKIYPSISQGTPCAARFSSQPSFSRRSSQQRNHNHAKSSGSPKAGASSQSDPPGAQSPAFDDSTWKPVTLPHDWSIAGHVDENAPSRAAGGFFPTGIGWYRRTLTLQKLDPTKRIFIAFDGIMANSDVYCNGKLLGHRPDGYVSFNYDLTPHLHAGKNIIAVRVDDSQQPASRRISPLPVACF